MLNLLWQNDERWATSTLGYGPQTIKDWGCLTTALTMVLNDCGYNETPATVSQKMVVADAFFGAAINAYRIGEVFPNVALKDLIDCVHDAAPLAQIDADLAVGKPVLVCVDQSPAAGVQEHWVVLYGKEGNDYLMHDPWCYLGDSQPGKKNLLTQRYKNSGGTPAQEITQVLFLEIAGKTAATSTPAATAAQPAAAVTTSAPASAPATTTKLSVPTDSVPLTPTVDSVAFRFAPNLAGPLIRRLPLNTALQSLESRSATLEKLGMEGRWLNVQAPEGDQGYVAAWYVQATDGSTPTPKAAPTTVTATQDQLAFRSEPVINDNTLIGRVPLGTAFAVADPDAAQKIGVEGRWLKVKDASGREGYVAAWYIS